MVEVKNLVKKYGKITALNDVSFSVNKGEILGFLGPNGAGKSTSLNIITGYMSSNSGEVIIDGKEILKDPLNVRKKIGYLPEVPPLYLDMTVLSYLKFAYNLKKVKFKDKLKHITGICEKLHIINVKDRSIKNLSKGYKQRIGLANALLGNPPVLILDEPSVGLDPRQVVEMRTLIKNLGKDHTVILSSHVLTEVQEICDRFVIINQGEIVANETKESLLSKLQGTRKLKVTIDGPKETVNSVLEKIDGIKSIKINDLKTTNIFEYILDFKGNLDIRRNLFFALAKESLPILSLNLVSESLENVFMQLTKDPTKAESYLEKIELT